MKPAALPANEKDRLKALNEYGLLDTAPEEVYDDITRIASELCRTPVAIISLVDKERQWHKSKQGITADEDPRAYSFCAHAILEPDEIFIVPDARRDDRFATNPLTTGAPNIVFYAGVPLVNTEGYPLGSLCVIDSRIRTLTDNQLLSLKSLARLVVTNFELRKTKIERDRYQNNFKQANAAKRTLQRFLTHHVEPMFNDVEALLAGNPRPDQLVHLQPLQEAGETIKKMLNKIDVSKR